MLQQEQMPKGNSLRNVCIERKEMCPASLMNSTVESVRAAPGGLTEGSLASCQDHVYAEISSGGQPGCSQLQLHGERLSCHQLRDQEHLQEHSSHSSKAAEKCEDHGSSSAKLLPSAMPGSVPMRKPVDIMMHKDRINLLRQMSQVFNEEQHVAAADASSASEDEREEKDATKENMITRKKGSNICSEKPVHVHVLDKKSDNGNLRTTCEGKKKSASNGALKPLVSNSSEVGLINTEALALSAKSVAVDETAIKNKADNENCNNSRVEEFKAKEASQPEESCVKTNASSKSVNLEIEQGKVYHVSSYSKRVQEKISVKSFVGKRGEHVDIIDGFSFISFEDKTTLLTFELSTSGSRKLKCGKKIKESEQSKSDHIIETSNKGGEPIPTTGEVEVADAAVPRASHASPQTREGSTDENDVIAKPSNLSSTEFSAFSSSRLDEFLCKNSTLNISYDVPECRKTVEGVSKVWDEDDQDASASVKLRSSSIQTTAPCNKISSQKFDNVNSVSADTVSKTLPSVPVQPVKSTAAPNGFLSRITLSEPRPMSPVPSNASPIATSSCESNVKSSESFSTESSPSSLPCKLPKVVSKTSSKSDRKFLRPKSSEVFVCRGGKLVPLTSIIKRGSPPKPPEKKKTSDLIYVYHDGKFLTMGGSLCNVDPRYSRSLTSQVVLPINLINKPCQKRKPLTHSNFRAVLIDKRMADFALSALRKPISTYKDYHKNSSFVRNGPLNCRRQGAMAKVKPRTTKSSILDIITQKLAIDVVDGASRDANVGSELERRDSKLVQKNLHRFPSLSREMQRLDKKYIPSTSIDAAEPGREGGKQQQQQQLSLTCGPAPEDLPMRGCFASNEARVKVKRCEVKVPWYRLPPSLKVWCLVHHCYDCSCGLAAPAPDPHVPLRQPHQDGEVKKVVGHQENSFSDHRFIKALGNDFSNNSEFKDKPEDDTSGDRTVLKVKPELLSPDAAFTALMNSRSKNRDDKEKESELRVKNPFETLKSNNFVSKNALVGSQGIFSQKVSGLKLYRNIKDKIESSPIDNKTPLGFSTLDRKVTEHGSRSKTSSEVSSADHRPLNPSRKRENSIGSPEKVNSSRCRKFKAFLPTRDQEIPNMKSLTEGLTYNRASSSDVLNGDAKTLEKLSLFGSSFSSKNFTSPLSMKATDDHASDVLERSISESSSAQHGKALDTAGGVGSAAESPCDHQSVLPECVILELCVGQREGTAGRASGPTIHNIIKHWSHDTNHSARTCGYSREGKSYRAVLNPQKQGFDYMPPIAPCNSNATIKSVLSAFLKRGYIRDVQNEDRTLKYEPEEANAVYCRNRNLPVAERKTFTPAAQIVFPKEGCESPVRPSPVSSCKSLKTPVTGPSILLSSSPSKSSICANIASDKGPVSSCITRPAASPGINNTIITTNSSSYGSKSSNSCSSLGNQGSCGEMKLKMAWKRGHQPGESAAVTSCVSLPEMVQAEERRGELELDLTPAPPGTAMLVTEARFRKLINMNIIGVIGLNKQSRCIIAPVESSEMLAKMRLIQTQISNRLLDVGPNMRDIFFPPHQPTGTVVKPRFIMIRCDKSGSWEIAGLVQKKSSEHQADNVHFTTSDIFDTSPAKKAYGCDQLQLKSETSSAVGSLKKPFSSAVSLAVSSSPSSASASFSESILVEISDTTSSSASQGELRPSDTAGCHKPPPSFEHETMHLSSETSVTNSRTEPLPSISSELLTPSKSVPLYTVKTHSKDKPIISFNLISFSNPTTSSSKRDVPPLLPLHSTSTHAHRSSVFSKISSNFVQNRDSSCTVETDDLSRSSSICKTTNVTSTSISSSSFISTPCDPAPNSGLSPMKMNVVYKVPLTLTNILRPSSTQASFSGSSCSNSVNVMSALETDVRPINCQHKDDAAAAATSQSSPSKESLVTCKATCQPSLSSHKPSVRSQEHFPQKDTEAIPKKSECSKISSSSNEISSAVCPDGAQVLSSAENLLVEKQIDAVGCRQVKNCEKPPLSLTFTESRPSELSSLSMTSLSSKSTTTSIASASIENKTTINEFTKPAITKNMKWAAIDLSINFKSIKLGWLKGTIQKSILAQIRSTSLESCGVVTFTVRGSEEETILYGRSKVMRKPNIVLLILGSSIAALDVASALSIVDLFKNNMMAYVFRGDEGERTFYRYVAPNFLTPIESKKEASSPTKLRRLPLELFRESSVSHHLLKESIINNDISNEPSSVKSSFSCLLTDTASYQVDPLASKLVRNEKLIDSEETLSKEKQSLKVDAKLKVAQLPVGVDAGGESITVSSEVTDSGVPQSAVLACHEITHCSPLVELSCSAQPATQWLLPPGDDCKSRKEAVSVGAGPDGCADTVPPAASAAHNAACAVPSRLPHRPACPVPAPAAASGGQFGSSQSISPSHETQSSSASEHELSICLSEDSVQIFPAEDEGAGDEVASLTVSSTLCEKDKTTTKELLGERMKSPMRRNSFVRIRKSKVKARRGSKLLQRYSNGSPGKDIGLRAWRAESAGARVSGPSSLARMRAAVARGNHKNGKAITLKRSSSSNAVGSGSHPSAIVGERAPLEVTEGATSDGYGSSSGSSRASRRTGHGRGKDSSHNEMERLRRKEIGELFVELQAVLQQEKGEDLPDCKKEVWPKRMTLKMAISLLEAKREQQWMLARKEEELVQQLNANKRRLRSLLEHSQASAKDREAAEELLKVVAPPSRVKDLDQLEQWAAPATKRCRPDTSDEEYVLDVEGSDSNTSEDLCTTLSTPASSPPYAAVPRALSAHRPGQKLSKTSPLSDSTHMRRLFVQENGKRKKLMSSEPCKSGRGQGRMRLLAYEGAQSRDSSSDTADDVGAAVIDSGGESSSASDASTEAPPSLSFSTLSFSNLPSQLLPTSMCSEPLLSSSSKPSSPDRDLL